jgi:uncharacterized MAPEG superfamily protein
MTTELRLLVASVILGLVQLIAASHLISFQYGYRWTGGSRDEPVPPLRGLANRVDQATTNFLETFPLMRTRLSLAAQRSGRGSHSRPDVRLPSQTQSATRNFTAAHMMP